LSGGDGKANVNSNDRSLETLLGAIAENGDKRAFAELFEYFAPRVKGFLMKGGASDADADDLAQEVMVKVFKKAKLFDNSRASAATWIFAIARNARIDAIRRATKPDLDPDEPMLTPEEAPRADVVCELKERDARIKEAVRRLPAEQREAMMLHFYADEPHSAIAERLELPLGTVKSRLRLAIEKVRRELDFDDE